MFISNFALKKLLKPLDQAIGDSVDLTVSVPPKAGVLWLSNLLNRLLDRFQAVVIQIAANSVHLAEIAPELVKVATDLEKQVRNQQERSRRIANAGTEIGNNIHKIAERAAESAQAAQYASALAQRARSDSIIALKQARAVTEAATALTDRLLDLEKATPGSHAWLTHLADAKSTLQILKSQSDSAEHANNRIVEELEQGAGTFAKLITHTESIASETHVLDGRFRGLVAETETLVTTVREQTEWAGTVKRLGDRTRNLSEDLLISVGVFHFDAHRKARSAVEALAESWNLDSMDSPSLEEKMRKAVSDYPFFELLYVTDSTGKQITRNVSDRGLNAAYGDSGLGREWSGRSWFQQPAKEGATHVSDIYRSLATDTFCFTISTPLTDRQGKLLGVLGADIHFDQILRL